MARYVAFIVRHRAVVVTVALILTGLFALQLRHLHFELRRGAQLPQHHPYVQTQNAIADRFGGDTTIIIGIVAQHGDIFTPEILRKIANITHRLEDTPGVVTSNLLSLASSNVKAIRHTPDGIDVRPFLREVPTTAEGLAELKRAILADEIYAGLLVARDGGAAAVVADFDEQLTDTEIYALVEGVIGPERDETVELPLGGAPVVREYAARHTRAILFLFPVAVLIIAVVHYVAFRTVQAMLLPLVTALMSVIWALGVMGALRQPMDIWSAITPVVILAVAAGHAVQILKRYYEEYPSAVDSHQAVIRSLSAVGPVTLTAGVIASAGFGSLATFGVTSVRVFGLLMASGILSSLIIEMTFIPACRAMLPPPRGIETGRERGGKRLAAALDIVATQAITHPRRIIVGIFVVLVCAMIGALRLHVDNSLRAWFPRSSRLRVEDRVLNERLAGTSTLYILLEGEEEGALEEPEVIRAIGDLQKWLERDPEVGATLSIANFVLAMHRAMGGDGFPDSRPMIAQYLFLYSLSGPGNLSSIVDRTHRTGVLRAYVKTDEAEFARGLLERLRTFIKARFGESPVKLRLAGGALSVQLALNDVVVREKVMNIIQVAGIIFLVAAVVFRSIVGGLLVLAPLTVAVALNLGIMGLTGTWLSIATASITAMAVGIGADFAVYLLFRVREEVACRPGEMEEALRVALQTSGRAIFFVASAITVGYLVLTFSGFRIWTYLGALTAVMMAASAVGTVTIIPALLSLFRPKGFSCAATAAQAHHIGIE